MSRYSERMAAITELDRLRRAQREQAELATLGLLTHDDYYASRGITGEPSDKNRVHRASDDCWKRGMKGRTKGIAPNTTTTNGPTVAVIVNGETTIVPASTFSKRSTHTKQREHAKRVATERQHRITAADLAPIVTHYD